ncbi:hypothetical protein MKZ38_003145 [Zalerion maritima]|uniref:Cyclin n=1 Tax=Zalerion maritima TaxID=339359 RepID=A0AAD5WXP2_9PEZI|nr:hypothetical protein MKZ38_003145 [Zalerion maritima]
MIATSQHSHESQYHSSHRHSLSPQFHRSESSPDSRFPQHVWDSAAKANRRSSAEGASRFPSPPSSSTNSPPDNLTPNDGEASSDMATEVHDPAPVEPSSTAANSIPSPDSDDHGIVPKSTPSRPNSSAEVEQSEPPQCKTIHVRDLQHIQELSKENDMGNGPGILNEPTLQTMKYEISAMPIHDIIEMVAALLTKITTTNDLKHDAMSRNATHQQHASSHNEGNREMSPFSSSVLAFHGKNVPAITILSYLARIHKYCPTTYEVFLSLLVYFDRMTERVNDIVMKAERERPQREAETRSKKTTEACNPPNAVEADPDVIMHEVSDDDLADEDEPSPAGTNAANPTASGQAPATYFVVDSFNIHRLVIAGVTCASKFFSDVFYTNSRYAKVGGLPLAELNHLEIQFLLLNDFRLSVPVEDLEAYATMLVEFYAREVVSRKPKRGSGVP